MTTSALVIARRSLFGVPLTLLLACSADEVTQSEPKLETPGAFIAVEAVSGGFNLFRTISPLRLDNGKLVLFVLRYGVNPKTLAEARALSRGAPMFSMQVELILEEDFVARGYEIVWFRTLTDEERDAVL